MSSEPADPPIDDAPPPVARIRRRRRWTTLLVWLVPLVAAVVAGQFVWSRMNEWGPAITIMFRDATGLKIGQTEIRYRGVPVGEVTGLELSPDRAYVVVTARLRRDAADVARTGSVFWVVRPEVGIETVRGLATVITGPYIEVFPGSKAPKTEFIGFEQPPPGLGTRGLHIILASAQFGSIRPRTAVTYRGIQVGTVLQTTLSRDATTAHIHVLIEQRYARLVRIGSRFWTASGVDVNLSLFKGVEINIESLRSLVAGGIAFATPESPESQSAKDGTIFVLHDKPDKQWLTWAPKVPIPPEN
jgi:paraquat-inducible protein B